MSNYSTTIDSYTRRQAIADGVLVDVTRTAWEAGFKSPVAVTRAAWARCVRVPAGADNQDESGRLWDLLSMLRYAILLHPLSRDELRYRLLVVTRAGADPELVEVKALCGPGDDGELCLTVLMPDED